MQIVKLPNGKIRIKGAPIILRNFAGAKKMYNEAGNRNFAVILDQDSAEKLEQDGWKVNYFKQRDPDEAPQAFLKVKVNYNGGRDIQVIMVCNTKETPLSEDDIACLDQAEIEFSDMSISPYQFEEGAKKTAYLRKLRVEIADDFGGDYD